MFEQTHTRMAYAGKRSTNELYELILLLLHGIVNTDSMYVTY